MSGARMSKSRQSVQATVTYLKKTLGLALTPAEQQAEACLVSIKQEATIIQE